MYGELASTNPSLLARGPIQIFPQNLELYLAGSLWLCLGLLLGGFFRVNAHQFQARLAGLLLGIAATTHLLVLRMVPFPFIDVFTAITEASVALLEGRNPYQISYTDIYQGRGLTPSGFGYLPGLFPWSLSGMFLAGDIRAGNFLALVGLALLLVMLPGARGGAGRFYLAALLFLGGAGLFVAEQAWIDPILAFLIFASSWLPAKGRLIWAAGFAGLLCATKQYGVVAFGFLCLMAWNREGAGRAGKFFLIALLAGVLVQIPFCLWNFSAYWNTVFVGIGNLPFRPDAYTLISWFSARGLVIPGVPVLGALVFLALAWKFRKDRCADPGTVLFVSSVAYMAIFLTNRHAFCNYFQLVFLLLLGSLYFKEFAAGGESETSRR